MSQDHTHNAPHSDVAMRVKALESLLTEKGLLDPVAIDTLVDTYQNRVGPRNGAKVVARAWTDADYKARLLEDGSKAIVELGFSGVQGEDMVVVENTDAVHNVVVCTLCSCYPWPTLGLPPIWFKSAPYRARAVIDPRGVLKEFGVEGVRGRRGAGLGQQRGAALPGAAATAGRHGGHERGRVGGAGDPRLDDWYGAGGSARRLAEFEGAQR